jgi:hypothetical protein
MPSFQDQSSGIKRILCYWGSYWGAVACDELTNDKSGDIAVNQENSYCFVDAPRMAVHTYVLETPATSSDSCRILHTAITSPKEVPGEDRTTGIPRIHGTEYFPAVGPYRRCRRSNYSIIITFFCHLCSDCF